MPLFGAPRQQCCRTGGILRELSLTRHLPILARRCGPSRKILVAQSAAASRVCPLTFKEMPTACKHCGAVLDIVNRVFSSSMDHCNKLSGAPYIKSECRPCHNRLNRVRHQLKKKHPAPAAGTPCTCCGAVRKLHMDHCHRTDKFRGWICNHCNTMIGLAGESRRGLEDGIRYLARSGTDTPDSISLET